MNRPHVWTPMCNTIACLLLAAFISVIAPCRLSAAPLDGRGDQDKSATQELLDKLDDIDVARSIQPLKLTAEQYDKLITTLTDANARYDKKIADLTAATFGPMAEEIRKRHKAVMGGAPASDEFDEKVRQAMGKLIANRTTAAEDAKAATYTDCAKILTAEQQKTAAKLEKSTWKKLGKTIDPSSTDAQYFNLYVLEIFVNYRRILPLLKDMKAGVQ